MRDIAAWRPPTGDRLTRFVRHRVWRGLYFGKDPILGQESGQAFIIRISGNDFPSQGKNETLPDGGDPTVEDDKGCAYWRRYGRLCCRVLFQEIDGTPAYPITRENG